MTIDEMLARAEIRMLLESYNIGGDRGRLDQLSSAFASDGELVRPSAAGGPQSGVGPEGIRAMLASSRSGTTGPDRPLEFVRHHLTTSQITFDSPDHAKGRTYFLVVSEVGIDHSGLYVDEFRKVNGTWKIARREARIDWVAPNGHTRQTRGA
jgi:hypothetical protein